MNTIKTILVPTDFSDASTRALAYARHLADTFGAALHILHVIEDPYLASGYMEMYAAPPADYLVGLEQSAQERLQMQLSPADKAKYSAALVTRIGTPAHEILAYAGAHTEIDLIVMATGGRGTLSRLMMGSVANKILREAPCPVLTVHPSDREHPLAASPAA